MTYLSSVCKVAVLGVVFVSGCDRRPSDAGLGASPLTNPIAVGPIPGLVHERDSRKNPFEGNDMAVQEGRTLFDRYNCSGCHGDHGGGGMGPSLRDADWIYGGTDAKIFSSIAEGRSQGMPAWGTKIPDAQLWKIVSYVRSMRTKNEPDAPDQSIPPPPMP